MKKPIGPAAGAAVSAGFSGSGGTGASTGGAAACAGDCSTGGGATGAAAVTGAFDVAPDAEDAAFVSVPKSSNTSIIDNFRSKFSHTESNVNTTLASFALLAFCVASL